MKIRHFYSSAIRKLKKIEFNLSLDVGINNNLLSTIGEPTGYNNMIPTGKGRGPCRSRSFRVPNRTTQLSH